jgi:regulator of replication initiation timing
MSVMTYADIVEENTVLKEENERLSAENGQLRKEYQLKQEAISSTGASVNNVLATVHAVERTAVAERTVSHDVQLERMSKQISVLNKENDALRARQDVLTTQNAQLQTEIDILKCELENIAEEVSAVELAMCARDAFISLEHFICREARLKTGWSEEMARKKKCTLNIKTLRAESVPLPAWVADIEVNIDHYQQEGVRMVQGPFTKESLLAAMVEEDDDADDTALKKDMVARLEAYCFTANVPFGRKPCI